MKTKFTPLGVLLATIGLGLCLSQSHGQERHSGPDQFVVVRVDGERVELTWDLVAVTSNPPYLFHDVQVRWSPDLNNWADVGEIVRGGEGEESRQTFTMDLALDEATEGFFQLRYQFDGSGGNYAGFDFSGADLRHADFSDANLTNASFRQAAIGGAVFSGADLLGTEFDPSVEPALVLDRLGGNLARKVSEGFPDVPYFAQENDFVTDLPGFEDIPTSAVTLILALSETATLGDVNTLLQTHGGSLAGSIGSSANVTTPLVAMRFSAEADLPSIEAQLISHAAVTRVVRDFVHVDRSVPPVKSARPRLDWTWDSPSTADGNWGLEWARVPQMWSLNDGIDRLAQRRGGLPSMAAPVVVVDGGFQSGHVELAKASLIPGNLNTPRDHGTHVAGTAGATFETGRLEGVDPYMNLQLMPASLPFSFYSQLKDIAWLAFYYQPRVINCSYGYSWYDRKTRNVIPPETRPEVLADMDEWSQWAAAMFSGLRLAGRAPLIVIAAGNDSVDTQWAGALERYSRVIGTTEIITVGAQDLTSDSILASSNTNVEVLAPGSGILSCLAGSGYGPKSGTSMAAPHVTGLAAYLLHLNPGLTNGDLKSLLSKGKLVGVPSPGIAVGTPGPIDAFHSALLMDTVNPPSEAKVLQLLLDIDDGSPDGNLRVEMPGITVPSVDLPNDRAFDPPGEASQRANEDEDIDGDGGIGDWRIDMADFRRWRDWLIFGEGTPHGLNGDPGNMKNDVNRDGEVHGADEIAIYPRGDFNGDGKLSNDPAEVREVPGLLENKAALTDLQVLVEAGRMGFEFWKDDYYLPDDLEHLVDSVDIIVSARHVLETKAPELEYGLVAVYDEATDMAAEYNPPTSLTRDDHWRIFTVPVGKTYYVKSDPITVEDEDGDEVQRMMRSIGSLEVAQKDRGADYMVDLTAVEMTAKVSIDDDVEIIKSEPDEERVEAILEAAGDIDDESSTGCHAWANDQGTFRTVAATGLTDATGSGFVEENVTFLSKVVWRRAFDKKKSTGQLKSNDKFKFSVDPMDLVMIDGFPNDEEMEAFAELRVERRYYGVSSEWETMYYTKAKIAGERHHNGGDHNFRLEEEERFDKVGDLPDPKGEFELIQEELEDGTIVTLGAKYRQEAYDSEIPIDDILDGDSFEVRYTMTARAFAAMQDEFAHASIGDPIDYGGVKMGFGNFGELVSAEDCWVDDEGRLHVGHRSFPGFYFILLRIPSDGGSPIPVAMALGAEGNGELIDLTPEADATCAHYKIQNFPLDLPRDTDGDTIDDVYELSRPHLFDPFDPTDANKDSDGDGLTDLAEYQSGTDPEVPDMIEPSGGRDRYPGLVVDTGLNGGALRIADLNGDGLLDAVTLGWSSGQATLEVALANPNETFQNPFPSPLGDLAPINFELADLNGDTIPDAVIVADPVAIFLGDGAGHFIAAGTHASGSIHGVATGDWTGDGVPDLFLLSNNPRSLVILKNLGSGHFEDFKSFTFESTPLHAEAVRLNDDVYPDVAVTLQAREIAVFLGSESGLSDPVLYPGGASAERFGIGDVNGDGFTDIVTANKGSDDISVLLALGDGSLAPEVRYASGDTPRDVSVRDLDGDGHTDLLVAHFGSGFHTFFTGDGTGNFTESRPVFSSSDSRVVLQDWDNDGRDDLVSPAGTGRLLIARNEGQGTFATRDALLLTNASIGDLQLADVDGDGDDELLLVNQRTHAIDVWEHGVINGERRLLFSLQAPGQLQSLAVIDLNGDDRPDMVTLSAKPSIGTGMNQLTVFQNDGGTYSPIAELPLEASFTSIIPAQIDDDPLPDLLATARNDDPFTEDNEVQAVPFFNRGNGQFIGGSALRPGLQISQALAKDLDADGIDEIILSGFFDAAALAVFNWSGDGGWSQSQQFDINVSHFMVADARDDAEEELVTTRRNPITGDLTVEAYRIAGGNLSDPETLFTSSTFGDRIHFADVDGDTRLDLYLTSGNTVAIHTATSEGGWNAEAEIYYIGGIKVILTDLNGDERPDILTWGLANDSIGILLHE